MLPSEWASMGGQNNCDCSTCIGSELYVAPFYARLLSLILSQQLRKSLPDHC